MSTITFLDKGPSGPLYVETEGGVFGVFYNSWDKLQHLAFYVPNRSPPRKTLCDTGPVNFSSSRSTDHLCPECVRLLKARRR